MIKVICSLFKYNKMHFKLGRFRSNPYVINSSPQCIFSRDFSSTKEYSFKLLTKEENEEFKSFLPNIIKDVKEISYIKSDPSTEKRISDMLEYTIDFGKKIRAVNFINSVKVWQNGDASSENRRLIYILGWCIEMLNSAIVIQDDLMDQSETRRGYPCWYKLPGVNLQAINDSLLLENAIYKLLKKYLSNHNCYISIVEEFHETLLRTAVGQTLDMQCVVNGEVEFDKFSMELYKKMVFNKSAYYTIAFPTIVATYFAEKMNAKFDSEILPILMKLGYLIQTKDDFLDCFGTHYKMGEKGTDIPNGKCTWLAVKALELSTPNQRKTFKQCYGKPGDIYSNKIIELYKELKIPEVYLEYEKAWLASIHSDIEKVHPGQFPLDIFSKLFDSVHLYSLFAK